MKKKCVLLLVKDTSLERVITLLLKQADYHVISGAETRAVTGQVTCNLKPDNTVDAVISCAGGSETDDWQTAFTLHNNGKSVPVLAIIPYGSEQDDVEMIKNNGCSSILHSPFEPDELLGSLEKIFN